MGINFGELDTFEDLEIIEIKKSKLRVTDFGELVKKTRYKRGK